MNASQLETYVGIDIGGTSSRLAIVDSFGRVLSDRREPTPTGGDGEDLVRWIEQTYHVCRGETDSHPPPLAIGVGVPGVLEPGRSAVLRSINLPFIEGLPLRDRLIERTGLPAVLDCDSIAAGWGEYCACEKRPKRFAYMTIGTGIGIAIIMERQVVRHTHHSAGHFGHIICDTSDDAPVCRCGLRGCLEALVAGPALSSAARRMGIESPLEEIESSVQQGDALSRRFVAMMARPLAIALADVVNIYSIDSIVIGGGAALGLPSLVFHAGELIHQYKSILFPDALRIEPSALGQYSGVVGAALLAAEHCRTM